MNEAIVEDAALSWFRELSYAVAPAPHRAPGEIASERNSFADVVRAGRVRDAITRLNPLRKRSRQEIKCWVQRILRKHYYRPDFRDEATKPCLELVCAVGSVVCLVHPKGIAFAFRTAGCNRSRNRPREMLNVSAGSAFRAERSQFVSAREKC